MNVKPKITQKYINPKIKISQSQPATHASLHNNGGLKLSA